MLIAGITGQGDKRSTSNLVYSILAASGKKISMVDSNSLIGLDCKLLRNYLTELERNSVEILILKIGLKDVSNKIFNHLHFDIMIYTDKADDIKRNGWTGKTELMSMNLSLLDEKCVAIVNMDDRDLVRCLKDMKRTIVTYGFNSKANITTSSIGDMFFKDSFICCLQRTIVASNGTIIEPQEYKLKMGCGDFDTYSVLAAATFALINGVDLNRVTGSAAAVQ